MAVASPEPACASDTQTHTHLAIRTKRHVDWRKLKTEGAAFDKWMTHSTLLVCKPTSKSNVLVVTALYRSDMLFVCMSGCKYVM